MVKLARRPITLAELDNFEIEERNNRLYWHGRPVRTKVRFSWLAKVFGGLISVLALVTPLVLFLANYESIRQNVQKYERLQLFCFAIGCDDEKPGYPADDQDEVQ